MALMSPRLNTLRTWIFFLTAISLGGWLLVIGSDPWLAIAKASLAGTTIQWVFSKLATQAEKMVIQGLIATHQAEMQASEAVNA